MTAHDLSKQAHGFLLRAIQKRAWGESVAVDSFDPSDLVEELRPAISEAIEAVGDRAAAASIMLDLYRRYAGSDLGAISMLFRASRWHDSDAFRVACTRIVQQSGPEAIELLLEALADVTDGEAVVDYMFDMCRVAANAISDPATRLNVLRTAFRQALDTTEDHVLAEVLREGLDLAAQQDQRRAVGTLLDYYHHEAAIGGAGDPLLLLDGLVKSLRTAHDVASSGEATLERFKQTLREAIADEGAEQLWDAYQYYLEDCGESGGMENAEALLETYSATVQAVTDLKWLADRLCEVCVDIAHTQDDVSYLLPDRWQVSNACLSTMEAAMAPIAVRDALLDAFRIAVERCDDPQEVLSKAFADIMNRIDGDASQRISHMLVHPPLFTNAGRPG